MLWVATDLEPRSVTDVVLDFYNHSYDHAYCVSYVCLVWFGLGQWQMENTLTF